MAGKSTLLRQVGLCVVLAQIGSFAPVAARASGVVDRLFTRVAPRQPGARPVDVSWSRMSETSAILHAAPGRSLVLLTRLGAGTSTYDGVAIAWAVTECLHTPSAARRFSRRITTS